MKNEMLTETEIVVIGTSAGGVDILSRILPAFKKTGYLKIAVVIHMPSSGPNLIPSLMQERCELTVKEADSGEPMLADHIYIAPPNYHLCIEPDLTSSLSSEGPLNFSRPSIDILFESAAYTNPRKVAGVLLTGANEDGAYGLSLIQKNGGVAVVQNPSDAEYPTMPNSALKLIRPDLLVTTTELINLIRHKCSGDHIHA